MKNILFYILILLSIYVKVNSQITQEWAAIYNGPDNFGDISNSFVSICFINSLTGWVVDSNGLVFKTTSGGE